MIQNYQVSKESSHMPLFYLYLLPLLLAYSVLFNGEIKNLLYYIGSKIKLLNSEIDIKECNLLLKIQLQSKHKCKWMFQKIWNISLMKKRKKYDLEYISNEEEEEI